MLHRVAITAELRLGRTGDNYFYAMEFVEGETLDNLIKRSGRLKVKLALEIVTQATAGLAAIHQQNLTVIVSELQSGLLMLEPTKLSGLTVMTVISPIFLRFKARWLKQSLANWPRPSLHRKRRGSKQNRLTVLKRMTCIFGPKR